MKTQEALRDSGDLLDVLFLKVYDILLRTAVILMYSFLSTCTNLSSNSNFRLVGSTIHRSSTNARHGLHAS